MNIDLNKIDITDFNMRECYFGGDEMVWCFPKLEGVAWNKENLILRSSIWRKSDGLLISPGFKKFFNWSQEPDLYPPPDALTANIKCVEKLDGSCLIVSKYKDELIIRTRRAVATTMLNGHEIEFFKRQYPKVFSDPAIKILDDNTLIFEWVTPLNQIVVKYENPDIKLIGCISNQNYQYLQQDALDVMADTLGVCRPRYFSYDNIEKMLENVSQLRGEEGVCVYYGKEQHIRKIKSEWYLSVHNFRNAMNLKNIVELYFTNGMPTYNDFCTEVLNQFTYEGLMMAQPLISQVCDAMKTVNRIIEGMRAFITEMKLKPKVYSSRKEMAEHILASYGHTNRADIAFSLLDGKTLGVIQYKKLLFQSLV